MRRALSGQPILKVVLTDGSEGSGSDLPIQVRIPDRNRNTEPIWPVKKGVVLGPRKERKGKEIQDRKDTPEYPIVYGVGGVAEEQFRAINTVPSTVSTVSFGTRTVCLPV